MPMTMDSVGDRMRSPELDGIRGVAILMVIAYHYAGFQPPNRVDAAVNALSEFGWAGVDLFFVLSGFLITGILWDSKADERSLTKFYCRRILRIFPLYYVFLALLSGFAAWIAPERADSRDFIHLAPWYWLYGVNFLVAQRRDFNAMPFGTGILWSLAIEEQFYLLWPLAVLKLQRGLLMRLCVLLVLCSVVLRVVLQHHGWNATAIYTITPTRMDALAAGAFAALLLRGPELAADLRRYGLCAFWAGAVLVGAAVLRDRLTNPYGLVMQRIGYTGIALVGLGLILATRTLAAERPLRAVLRSRFLRFFGRYSYALYMVHFVVREVVFARFPPLESLPRVAGLLFPWVLLRAACTLAVSVGIALLSWHLIEKRFLALKRLFGNGRRETPLPVS